MVLREEGRGEVLVWVDDRVEYDYSWGMVKTLVHTLKDCSIDHENMNYFCPY